MKLFVVVYKHVLLYFCIFDSGHRIHCVYKLSFALGYLLLFTVNNIVYKQKSMTLYMWLSICTLLQNFMSLPVLVFELW